MDELIQKSNYKILNYKLELHKLYTIIFKFCKDNYVIISNYNYNISTINKENYDLIDINYDFKFILFSFNPKKDAINLVNKLYANYSKYTFMSSYINNKEILITSSSCGLTTYLFNDDVLIVINEYNIKTCHIRLYLIS